MFTCLSIQRCPKCPLQLFLIFHKCTNTGVVTKGAGWTGNITGTTGMRITGGSPPPLCRSSGEGAGCRWCGIQGKHPSTNLATRCLLIYKYFTDKYQIGMWSQWLWDHSWCCQLKGLMLTWSVLSQLHQEERSHKLTWNVCLHPFPLASIWALVCNFSPLIMFSI